MRPFFPNVNARGLRHHGTVKEDPVRNRHNYVSERQTTQFQPGQRTWIGVSPERTCGWPAETYEKTLDVTDRQRNANSNHNELSPHTSQSGSPQEITKTSVAEELEETGPLGAAAGIADWYDHCGKRSGDSPKSRHTTKDARTRQAPFWACTQRKPKHRFQRFYAPRSAAATGHGRKDPKGPSADDCVKESCSTHTMECYPATKARGKPGPSQQHRWT